MASSEYLAILSAAAASKKQQTPSSASAKQPTSKLDLSNFDSEFPALSTAGSSASSKALPTPTPTASIDNYGLEGLVHVVRSSAASNSTTNPASNVNPQILLNLGTDLLSLGLDLNSADFLYSKFTSPWLDGKGSIETMLPACYYSASGTASGSVDAKILALVADETLFFVFYAMPRDRAQLIAAAQLWTRGWRYHKALKMWFTVPEGSRPGASPRVQALFSGKGQQASVRGEEELGTFVFFDFTNWQRVVKEYLLNFSQVEAEPAV